MTIQYQSGLIITGTAADRTGGTWTNLPAGWKFVETDTGAMFIWTTVGATNEWLPFDQLGYLKPKYRRAGFYGHSASNNPYYGAWSQAGTNIVVGSAAFSSTQRIGGATCARFSPGATANSITGQRVCGSTNPSFERSQNPWTFWKMNILTNITQARMFVGYQSLLTNPASSADPLANIHGVGFWWDTGVHATNIAIMQNNGAATSDRTTLSNVAQMAINTIKIYEIRAVESAAKFQYRVNGYPDGAWTDINTQIPASTQGLNFFWYVETLDTTVKTVDFYEAHHRQDA